MNQLEKLTQVNLIVLKSLITIGTFNSKCENQTNKNTYIQLLLIIIFSAFRLVVGNLNAAEIITDAWKRILLNEDSEQTDFI